MLGNPEANLKGVSEDTNISTTQCKKILNEAGIHYYERICTPPLTPEHVRKRWVFSNNFANLPYYLMPNIIFSDESTVVVDLDGGGVWRYRGEHPPESFYTKIAHPVQVMVWGAIGPNGYRTKLIQCQGHVNAQKYIDLLAQNHIIDDVKAHFGENFIWMQDNAPSHMAYDAIMWLHQNIPSMLDWPPRSPDLNPIEQLWNYIKRKIKGMNFQNANELFNTLSAIWDSIPLSSIQFIHRSKHAVRHAITSEENASTEIGLLSAVITTVIGQNLFRTDPCSSNNLSEINANNFINSYYFLIFDYS